MLIVNRVPGTRDVSRRVDGSKKTLVGEGIAVLRGIIIMKDAKKRNIKRNVFLKLISLSPLNLHS